MRLLGERQETAHKVLRGWEKFGLEWCATSAMNFRLFGRGGVGLLVAFQLWRQVENAWPLYLMWLIVAALYSFYQGRFLFATVLDRPLAYHATTNTLFVLDLLAYLAVGIFCSVGWLGIVLLVFSYFWMGRLGRDIALTRTLKDVLEKLDKYEPEMEGPKRLEVATFMVEQRVKEWNESR